MTVKLKKATNKNVVYNITQLITSITWSGSAKQASRKVEFSVINSPFDGNMSNVTVESGDIVYFYFDSDKKFVGRVTALSCSSKPGVNTYTAKDYMNILLRSKVYFNFKNVTPEKITEKVLSTLGIKKGSLCATNINITKLLADGETGYNTIVGAYYKAYKKNKTRYMPVMEGTSFSMIKKGEPSGVKLRLSENVTETTLEENAENVINKVLIYDDKGKKVGTVSDEDSIALFGIYQDIYKKEQGVNADTAAKQLMKGPEKTAKVSAIGDMRCVSGKSIYLYDDFTGLWGKFWIENDTHTISGGAHTMTLTLAFKNIMENVDESTSNNPVATGERVCYYTNDGEKYHSKSSCSSMVNAKRSTVNEATKLGKSKCSRCWQ